MRRAMSLVEVLIVIGIITMFLALLASAISAAREAARRTACTNNLRQIGIALQHHHEARQAFPPGVSSKGWQTWCLRLLPYLDRKDLWDAARREYQRQPDPFRPKLHPGMSLALAIYGCASDDRTRSTQLTHKGYVVGLTSYVGVAGTDYQSRDGVLFVDARITRSQIRDGLSQTVLVGERPPSLDYWYGWWYAGVGQAGSGCPDMLLGARERNIGYGQLAPCPPGPYQFGPESERGLCDTFHFYSRHPKGANFVFADGSVRFLDYDGDQVLAAMATRSGRDSVQVR